MMKDECSEEMHINVFTHRVCTDAKVPVGNDKTHVLGGSGQVGVLQALVVLDYKLIIVKRTAAVVQLGRSGGRLGLVLI